MKRSLFVASGILIAASGAFAQTVNFHDSQQGYAHYGGYNVLYYGQGAAIDPGNNVWNGFSSGTAYNTPGGTAYYGGSNPDSGHGSVPNGNPGNPYSWTPNSGTASGTQLFNTQNAGAGNVGNSSSAGTISPVTLSMNYGFDNGSTSGTTQGTPSWFLSEAAVVNAGSPGIGTSANPLGQAVLGNVPTGTYDLFLYGANFDGTRGASFTVNPNGGSSGTALGGLTSTINPNSAGGSGPLTTLTLGVDYVEILNVTPDSSGDITIDWGAVNNPNSGLSGEGDFNGLQLVTVPEPSILALVGMGSGMFAFLRRKK
jgi:hypothetical protein